MYTTKTTWLGKEYGCRVFYNDKLVVEGRCLTKQLIGPTFRDLLRTIDKCGGDRFTSAARKRKFRYGNLCASVKHWWGGRCWNGYKNTNCVLSNSKEYEKPSPPNPTAALAKVKI